MELLKLNKIILMFLFSTAICQAQTSFNISNKTTGDTLLTIDNNGRMGLGITVPGAGFHMVHTNGALFSGTYGAGSIPVEGAGTRLMWYPAKSAFRVGSVNGTQWDDFNIGDYSMAIGRRTTASGAYAQTYGNFSTASGDHSMAFGRGAIASGINAISIGRSIEASGDFSFAIGIGEQVGTVVSQDTTLAIVGGRVGIHTVAPTSAFEVADTIFSSFGGFKFPDQTVQTTAFTAGGGNTLDQAYDQGGAGAGRIIAADAGAFEVSGADGVLFGGSLYSGSIPVEGPGVRMMWYPAKAAFRAGIVDGAHWDQDSVGIYSYATGFNNKATGAKSVAMGDRNVASGDNSIALGRLTTATGLGSMAMGYGSQASGDYAAAFGRNTSSGGYASTALGFGTEATNSYSTAMGHSTTASGFYSTAMGYGTTAMGNYSTTIGRGISASGNNSVAIALSDQSSVYLSQNNTMAIMGGRVGIGTITPTTELEVEGDFILHRNNVTISSDGDTLRLQSYTGTITIDPAGGITIESTTGDISIDATNRDINLAGRNVNIDAVNNVDINGTNVYLNADADSPAAARQGDDVLLVPPVAPVAGIIFNGSPSVKIGD